MAWNEPGKDKDPWGRKDQQGPPDLDEIVRDFRKKLGGLFGGKPGGGGTGSEVSGATIMLVGAVALIAWALAGFYTIDARERGVELRFGAFTQTTQPGWHWIARGIESIEKVNVSEVYKINHQTRMLTADEAIVEVDIGVQYTRSDAPVYLFAVQRPDENLSEIAESAIREVVGKNTMDYIVNVGRGDIAVQTRELIQTTLDSYKAGIQIYQVNLRSANYPNQVEDAVQDVNKAREDKERKKFEAEGYKNDIVPNARGEAAKRLQDAIAYRVQVVEDARGEASRFSQVLAEYQKAPEVTRERLYIDAVEAVYATSSKVLLDTEGTGNLVYLPIDKLIENQSRAAYGGAPRAPTVTNPGGSVGDAGSARNRTSGDRRARGDR